MKNGLFFFKQRATIEEEKSHLWPGPPVADPWSKESKYLFLQVKLWQIQTVIEAKGIT